MPNDATPTRRQVVTAGAALTLGITSTAALSACSGASGSTGPAASGSSGSSGSQPGAGPSGPTSGAAPGDTPVTVQPPAVGGTATGAGGPLAKLGAVPVGGSIAATSVDGTPLVISRPQAGRVVAFSAVCTHMGCTVVPAGQKLLCPCHNSTFDPATGAVLGGLAQTPLPAVTIKIVGEDVVAG